MSFCRCIDFFWGIAALLFWKRRCPYLTFSAFFGASTRAHGIKRRNASLPQISNQHIQHKLQVIVAAAHHQVLSCFIKVCRDADGNFYQLCTLGNISSCVKHETWFQFNDQVSLQAYLDSGLWCAVLPVGLIDRPPEGKHCDLEWAVSCSRDHVPRFGLPPRGHLQLQGGGSQTHHCTQVEEIKVLSWH